MGILETSSQGRITWNFSGEALPYGAVTQLEFQRQADESLESWANSALPVLALACRDLHQLVASSKCQLDTIDVKFGPEATGPTYSAPIGVPGATGAEPCPPNVAMLVRKAMNGVSGRFQGRMFYPGISEGNVASDGTIPTPALGPYQAAFDDFFQTMIDGGPIEGDIGQPYVFSSTPGLEGRSVSSLDVQLRVATQRKRLRR